ncbi:alginate export family protein, partial [Sphingobium yanoikuyae]|uniref:alginate export family protein n=1 Tax=Sphingobium yanoikuyae TaxID=13690 RepID=UPI0028AB8285
LSANPRSHLCQMFRRRTSRAKVIGPATVELTYFHLGERDAPGRPTRDRSLDTFGGRVMLEPRPGQFDYEIEGFFQTGSVSISASPTAAHQRVAANFIHADAGFTFPGGWTPRLSIEYDRATGDKPGGKFGRFDTLFGMRRADLAPAGLYNALARTNIETVGVRFEAKPGQRIDWFAAYRPMWLAAREDSFSSTGVRDATGRSGDFAGHQLEGRIRYWFVPKRLQFEFDGVLLSKGRFLQDAPNATAGRWTRYASFNLLAIF